MRMLHHTMALAQSAQIWKEKYPQLPDVKQRKEAASLQQDAIEMCHAAHESARDTNNEFKDFNNAAQDFHNSTDQMVQNQEDHNAITLAPLDEQIRGLPGTPPWDIIAGGFFSGISVGAWYAQKTDEKAQLTRQRNLSADSPEEVVATWQRLADSGPRADGSCGNWSEAVESVSMNLGNIADILFTEKFQ
jgi:hypothetical protein